jgi:hypothetical protein
MKTLTKVIFVSLMSFFLTSSLFAQASANANATVTASLIKGLAISLTVDALDFGTIQLTGVGQTPAITPENGSVFQVLGHPNRDVDVTFVNATLTNNAWATPLGAPTDNLTFTPDVEETGSSAAYVGASAVTSGDAVNCPNVTGTGTLYLWVGGEIAIGAAQEAGDYTGTFTMNVAY